MEDPKKLAQAIKIDLPKKGGGGFVFIAAALLIVGVELGVLFWQVPELVNTITVNQAKIGELSTEVSKMETAVSVLKNVNPDELDSDLMVAEAALPSEKTVTGLVSALTSLASSSGVTADKIEISFGNVSTASGTLREDAAGVNNSSSDVNLENDVVGVPIVMEVSASDEQLLDLVGKIQQSLPLLGIGEVKFSPAEEGKKGQISVLVYSQPGDKFTKTRINEVTPLSQGEIQALESLSTKTNILQ